jgi:hypothetical protein
VTTLQPFQLGNLHMAKGVGNTPLAVDVSLPSSDFTNGAHYRLPWAVSRDLQTAAISGKELYFRVTDPLLKNTANGGAVKTEFDFEFSMFDGTAVPYVIKSYDGVGGTLMGVFRPSALAGSTGPTRGYLYFSNPAWTVSKEDHDQTFLNATSVLFLPSGVDKSGSQLDLTGTIPAIPAGEPQLVNPGCKCDGSTTFLERDLTGDCGSYLFSGLVQSLVNNSDNSPFVCGGKTSSSTAIFHRHLFATANGPTDPAGHTNAWRAGFANGTVDAYYETASGKADTSLQHVVFRRVLGQSLELYVNGVLVPWAWKQEATGALNTRISFAGYRLLVGRGATNNRYWDGYIDCFKFFKDDAKTAGWALAEYSNLMDIDGGVIFGSPETVTTSSVFGETIKVQTDQLTSVNFKADKYSATVGGTIALRSPNPFDPPDFGTLSDQGANTVRYTNTQAQDPDNGGAVHLTNGSGNVIIPVRAHIILTTPPPPPTGYYGIPNIAGKTPRNVSNRSEFLTELGKFGGAYSTTTDYIRLTGDISGASVIVNKGGTQAHPLVIMSDDNGNPDSWPASRPTVTAQMRMTTKYVWWYGVDFLSSGSVFLLNMETDWQFVTACRLTGQRLIGADTTDGITNNLLINYNAGFPRTQVGEGECAFIYIHYKSNTATATGITMVDPLMIARNYFGDVSGGSASQNDRQNLIYIGSGIDGRTGGSRTVRIEYNHINCRVRRAIYNKYGSTIKWNHIVPMLTGNSYGDTMAGFRGPGSNDAVCAYNRIVNGNQLMVNGRGHLILSNVVTGTCTIQVSCFQRGAPGTKDTPEADGCRVMGNTGQILLPAFDSNVDTPAGRLGDFDPGRYPGLPNGKNVVLAGPNQQYFEDIAGNAGPAVPIISNHPQQTQVGSNQGYRWRNSSQIWVYDTVDPAWGYVMETPPTLNTTVCGPKASASSKIWGAP